MSFKRRTATSAVVQTKQNEQFKTEQVVTQKITEKKQTRKTIQLLYYKREKLLTRAAISNTSLLPTRRMNGTHKKKNLLDRIKPCKYK